MVAQGLKLDKGSTPYFVVGMVIFSDFKEAEQASKTIDSLKKTLNVRPEFKFSKTHPNVKDAFFDAMQKYDFAIRALIVEKQNIYNPYFKNEKETFYNYFVKMLMRYDDSRLINASVKIDGKGAKVFKKALYSYLRQQLGSGKIRKFQFVDSEHDNLIQLADMVVGAIARHQNGNRKNASRWFNMLKEKIEDMWDFTETKRKKESASVP